MTAPRAPFMDPDEPIRDTSRPLEVRQLGEVDYTSAWQLQADLAAQVARGEAPDTLLVLTHPSCYTAGKRTQDSDRPRNGLPVIDVDRGGRITWHGPGQLVVYPIVRLVTPIDVVDYVRRVEEALIQVVIDQGLPQAGRIAGRSGVWLPEPDRKIAALGIRVTQGVTMHGLSLNCNNSLDAYAHIVPCGIDDAGVTTLSAELGREVTPDDVAPAVCRALDDALAGRLQVANHHLGSAPDPCR
ncbi:lipoate-protein ligase B [Corynebacterium sp. 13CS0277]|uniref:lipoyl(octanoyl) transferase LipB n=1 Tax=Corynebacterium sp. 13CS0277 TaxID=2071994 RepID=UPI000D02B95D|nr:lipoyl(octanoyl) transferase LipB [Corynebacterium sp. 13CS0277]PRQ11117.1 lipoate-protein ligase B [Corynebacterium sp. 13CS0277]